MSDARKAILARLKRACPQQDEAAIAARLARHRRNLVPGRAQVTGKDARALFIHMARSAAATLEEVESPAGIVPAVKAYLAAEGLPARLRLALDPLLAGLEWPGLETATGAAAADDDAAISVAFCAIAETGTLMMVSGPDNPVSLDFLPGHHVVVLPHSRILGAYEDAWDRLRRHMGEGAMPRAVNWITGPSRTADIEQTLVLGAHGPRKLHILLTREEAS